MQWSDVVKKDETWCYIFADGENARWPDGERKELVDIGGEPCVMRIVRQARRYTNVVKCISHDRNIQDLFPADGYNKGFYAIEPPRSEWKTEVLLTIYPDQPRDIVLLLGDTIYSKAAMDAIFEPHNTMRFFGNYSDILGVSIAAKYHLEFKDILQVVVLHALKNSGRTDVGHLWNCYRVSIGKPPLPHFDPPRNCRVFNYIDDWTRDIDTIHQYGEFCRDVIGTGKLDDRGEETE